MKMIENTALLDHKRKVEAERRERAIARRRQAALRATTPGVATPASIMGLFKGASQ